MSILVELRAAQFRAGQLSDIPMIRRLAEIARDDREQNARYRVVQSEIVDMRRVAHVVASGLRYDAARTVERDLDARLAAEHPEKTSWTRPMALLQMEARTCMVEVPAGYFTDSLTDCSHAEAA